MAEKSYELKQVDELAGGVAKLKLELEALVSVFFVMFLKSLRDHSFLSI